MTAHTRLPKSYSDDEIEGLLELLSRHPSEQLEDDTIEFKEYRDPQTLLGSKELAEEISALANWRGGMVLIGVRDSTNIQSHRWEEQLVGFGEIDTVEVKQRILGRLRPSIELKVNTFAFRGKVFLVIRVPYRRDTLVGTSSGKYCIREGRSSRPMMPDEVQQLIKAQVAYDWTSEPLDIDVASSLDNQALHAAITNFAKQRALSDGPVAAKYLEAIGATTNGLLTKGGLLFLGTPEAIRRNLGDYEFRFTWKTKSGALILNDVWAGCLWGAIQRAESHFGHCNDELEFTHRGKAYQVPVLDPVAFHEAYLNAMVHRDYAIEGMVTVSYTGDQMVITSPGRFYGGITSDNIAFHQPRHRNKALARILMLHHLVDRAGMGVTRMSLTSLRYGRKFPMFHEVLDSVEVVMEAGDFLRIPIFVLTAAEPDRFGVPELIVLNRVAETGFAAVPDLLEELKRIGKSTWENLTRAVTSIQGFEFCGTRNGVFVRVSKKWVDFFGVGRQFPVPGSSENHVKLYMYLQKHGSASNSEITGLLGYSHSSHTSRFLREAEYVERTGNGRSARWSIKSGY